jgi:hypothetical protein
MAAPKIIKVPLRNFIDSKISFSAIVGTFKLVG